MRSRIAIGLLCAVPLALAACSNEPKAEAAPPPPPPMGEAIANALRSGAVDSYMRKDSVAVADYYADDAVMYNPDGTVATGKPAILSAYGAMMKAGMDSLGITKTSFTANGDEAVEQGTMVMRTLDKNKEATRHTASYTITFKRQADGTFKIAKDSTFGVTEVKEK